MVTLAATPTVPAEATAPPTVESGADESWQRVQAAGKIVVGTSADYPPFEFYVEGSQIDGYDIALMDEIGRRLGVEVEYRDIAFDGLSGALQVGQVDAAIAAISVSPERQAVLDFSNVYYVGEDAALARRDSSANFGTPRDLAVYQIGVQMDTVYETWVQQALVDSGLMPIGNLHVYQKVDDALHDLDEQRVNLVILDAQAAEAAASARGLKVV